MFVRAAGCFALLAALVLSALPAGASDVTVLGFGDGSRLTLAGDTAVDMTQAGKVGIIPGGILRFDIRHPQGRDSDYTFLTPFARIAVRGTIALISDGPGGDLITCLDCGAGDVVATLPGGDYALFTGETMRITANGRVTIAKTDDAALSVFHAQGLSTDVPPEPKPRRARFRIKL